MSAKRSNWPADQQNRLKEIRESPSIKGHQNWKLVSRLLNEEFKSNWSSKQCRQKYLNYLKFDRGTNQYEWTSQELNKLAQLYMEHGSSWRTISEIFATKSENCIKNKFNNLLRRFVKHLNETESQRQKMFRTKQVNIQILISMLDFTNQIQKKIQQRNCKWNHESELFRFKNTLIKLSIATQASNYEHQQINHLLNLVGKINSRLRSFGVFKVKNRKNWKLSDESLHRFNLYNQIIEQNQHESTQKVTSFTVQENYMMSCLKSESSLLMMQDLESLLLDESKAEIFSNKYDLITQVNNILGIKEQNDHYGGFL